MEGYHVTGQSPQLAVVPMEEEEEEVYMASNGNELLLLAV